MPVPNASAGTAAWIEDPDDATGKVRSRNRDAVLAEIGYGKRKIAELRSRQVA